jgi:DtxR family manganese transport transcriptional regulator
LIEFMALPRPQKIAAKRTSAPPAQAESFRRLRRDHAVEIAQDYVEAIADLVAHAGEARVVDLARRFGVTHVTVNRTLSRLQRAGYVKTKPYRAILLTEAGRTLALESKQRHDIVVAFLRQLGVPPTVAEVDAEGIEHHVSPETLAAFKSQLKEQP